jgi:hypothetical protein
MCLTTTRQLRNLSIGVPATRKRICSFSLAGAATTTIELAEREKYIRGSLRFGRDDTKIRRGRIKILMQNLESRAEKIARCTRTLTFILSLTGRGEEIRAEFRKASITARELTRELPALLHESYSSFVLLN